MKFILSAIILAWAFVVGCSGNTDFTCYDFGPPSLEYPDGEPLCEKDHELDQVINRYELDEHPEIGQVGQAVTNFEAGAEICAGRNGPGQYCFVPTNLNINQYSFVTMTGDMGSDLIWFYSIISERNSVKERLNSFGWNFNTPSTSASANWTLNIENVHPTIPGRVGQAAYYVDQYVAAVSGGTYAYHSGCVVTIYKQAIEASPGYSSLTTTRKSIYVKDIVDHELTHCSGPGHLPYGVTLMSPDSGGYSTTNLNPTPTQLMWLDNYNP